MTEGGMIKLYVQKEKIDEAALTNSLGINETALEHLYQSQTIEPDTKKKLKDFFNRDIFNGAILTDYYVDVPDEQANKMKK